MAKTNRTIMQIPKDLLSEKNYEGTRLIEVIDEAVLRLNAELKELQKEAQPFIDEMAKMSPAMDPIYTELRVVEEKRKELKDKLEPLLVPFREEMAKAEKVEQKAQLIKDKMIPIINSLVKSELGEFETAKELKEKDGKIFVEVIDEIEEKIKAVRATKK